MVRPFHKRVFALTAILLIAASLRFAMVGASDVNVDEAWSLVHSYHMPENTGASFLVSILSEPNNAVHLVAVRPILEMSPTPFGLRLLSIYVGMITVALVARLAHRLFQRRDVVLLAAVLAALAYAGVWTSRYGRPYATANMLALASFTMWMEGRWRINMVTSALVPFFHVGAMPTVMMQDVFMVWNALRGRPVVWAQWILNRFLVYSMFGVVMYMVHYRTVYGRDVSGGQALLSPLDIVQHLMAMIHGVWLSISPGLGGWLFALLAAGIAAYGVFLAVRRQLPSMVWVLLLWVAVTYGALTFMVIFDDGPIKTSHISIVFVPVALAVALVVSEMPRLARMGVSLALVVLVAAYAISFVTTPARSFTEADAYLRASHPPGTVFYLNALSAVWALQISLDGTDVIYDLPEVPEERPQSYHFVRYRQWLTVPPECGSEPYDQFGEMTLYACDRTLTASN